MEDTTIQEAPVHYNPNQLVTYKVIDLDDRSYGESVAHYPTEKVTQIEYALEDARRTTKRNNELQSQINKIIDNLTEDYWYNPNTDKETILAELCEILEHEPKQEIRITGTITFDLRYDCPLEEVEDFDARYFLQDNLSVDAYHGDIVIDSYEVEDAEVDWR